ncbi:MAG TPA: glycosyltransferase [Chloroflexota bacterium]|nr:glycosyltransferase [Chloroflexota bacterium]
MHIFLSCLQSVRAHPLTHYRHWEGHFKRGIEEAGHSWVDEPSLDWAEGLVAADPAAQARWRARTWPRVVDCVRRSHRRQRIDLFLSYLFPQQIDREAVEEVRSLGIPCVNFFCDNVREFARIPPEYSPFDLHWVPEVKALDMYAREGLPAIFRPMPCWVSPEVRGWDHPEEYGVTFVGSCDELRGELASRAIQLGVPLELYGRGWDKTETGTNETAPTRRLRSVIPNQVALARRDGPLAVLRKVARTARPVAEPSLPLAAIHGSPDGATLYRVLQRSTVTLGINRYPSLRRSRTAPDSYSRLRDVEAPMVGACYVTEHTPEIERLYDVGEEVATYRSPEGLAETIAKLLADGDRRLKMRRGAQRRALTEHTVARSLEAIATALSLGPAQGASRRVDSRLGQVTS